MLTLVTPVGRFDLPNDTSIGDAGLLERLVVLDGALRDLESRLVEAVEDKEVPGLRGDACYIDEDLMPCGSVRHGGRGRRWFDLATGPRGPCSSTARMLGGGLLSSF